MIGLTIGVLAGILVALICVRAAYRNGVTDGYGYAREPKNPGYQAAGAHLRRYMAHRWPELSDVDIDRTGMCQECREDRCSSSCPCWCHGVSEDS